MYESLRENMKDFHLYILAFDDLSYTILTELLLQDVTVISLQAFESEELLRVKKERTRAEYCWTCTPSIIDFVITKFQLETCTYLDADLCFYDSPTVLLEEMQDNSSVLITEHRFSWMNRIYAQKRAGRFCVQFITFNQLQESRQILNTWKDQCIEWCYDRYEDGKFGDQKYLDAWPGKYADVHILESPGGGVAPWNVQQYRIFQDGDRLTGLDNKTGKRFKLVFYHFQYVKFLGKGYFDIGWHRIPDSVKRKIYLPYIGRLMQVEKQLESINQDYKTKYSPVKYSGAKYLPKAILKRIFRYNLIYYR